MFYHHHLLSGVYLSWYCGCLSRTDVVNLQRMVKENGGGGGVGVEMGKNSGKAFADHLHVLIESPST